MTLELRKDWKDSNSEIKGVFKILKELSRNPHLAIFEVECIATNEVSIETVLINDLPYSLQ